MIDLGRWRAPGGVAGKALLLALVLVLGACTEQADEAADDLPAAVEEQVPTPQVGVEAAIVLPPSSSFSDAVSSALVTDLRRLQETNEPEVRTIRPLRPDTTVFVPDMAEFAAQQRTDLTCVLGAGGAKLVSELLDLHPALRFCAVVTSEPTEPAPAGIDLLVLRAAELGLVIGASAAVMAEDQAVLAFGAGELELEGFVDGVMAGLAGTGTVTIDDDLAPEAAVAEVQALGAEVLVVGSGPGAPQLVEAAHEAGMPIIGPAELATGSVSDGFALTWRIRWDQVLQPAMDHLVGRSEPGTRSRGFAEDAFEVVPGSGAPDGLAIVVTQMVADLTADGRDRPGSGGELVPPTGRDAG